MSDDMPPESPSAPQRPDGKELARKGACNESAGPRDPPED